MKTFNVRIESISPLLQHRFSEAGESGDQSRTVVQVKQTPRQQAEAVCYRDDKHFYFPGTWIAGTLREAGTAHKLKGSRRSVKYIVPAGVTVNEVDIPLMNGSKLIKDFEVDSRPVVIPSTKGRIMRHRPRFDEWSANFSLEIDDQVIPVDLVKQLLEEAGRRVGIGDFRPQKTGPFGRFHVTEWKEVSA